MKLKYLLNYFTILTVCLLSLYAETTARPLRILFAVEVFPCSTQIFILNQITGLIDAGHDITIFAFRDKEYGTTNPAFPPEIENYDLLSKAHYNQLPHPTNFDIIYCQFGSTAKKILPLLKKHTTFPKLITCFRGGDASTALIKDPHAYDKLFKKADFLFPVCKHFAKRLIKHGCSPEKIIVHHSGIDCNAFSSIKRSWNPKQPLRIITVGRLFKEKGHEFAIKAVAKLAKKYPNLEYTIIGDGPYKGNLRNLINNLQMQKNIKLVGLVSHDKIPKILQDAHLFLLTPITLKEIEDGKKVRSIGMEEGIPNSLMEAMASGMPVIGTNHAGIPELIEDGVSGFLVPERDVQATYNALKWYTDNPKKWAQFGKAGREYVCAEHNIATQLKRLTALLERLVQKNYKKYRFFHRRNIISSSDFLRMYTNA